MKRRIDEESFIAAYDEYADGIFRYCYFRTYDKERAQELMQEAFTNAWSYLRQGKEIDNLRAFLYRTAHNACVNEAVRSKAVSLDEMQEQVGYDPADDALSVEDEAEAALVRERLQELNDKEREVLILRYMDGLPVKEIAQMLGEPPNTISVRIKRALESLKKTFDPTI